MGPGEPSMAEQQAASDEKACAERIDYALKKYGCMLDGTAIIKNGFTQIQIGVVKIPPEMRKAMKEAEKNGELPQAPQGIEEASDSSATDAS